MADWKNNLSMFFYSFLEPCPDGIKLSKIGDTPRWHWVLPTHILMKRRKCHLKPTVIQWWDLNKYQHLQTVNFCNYFQPTYSLYICLQDRRIIPFSVVNITEKFRCCQLDLGNFFSMIGKTKLGNNFLLFEGEKEKN